MKWKIAALALALAPAASAQVGFPPDYPTCPPADLSERYVTQQHRLTVCVPGMSLDPNLPAWVEWEVSSNGGPWVTLGVEQGYSVPLAWHISPHVWDQLRVRVRACSADDIATCTGAWSDPSANVVIMPSVDFDRSRTITPLDLSRVWGLLQRVLNRSFDGAEYK